ncbi:hypothetical protein SteCoe_17029 [Stentor coeruleus]|uniref:Uncharacterized protein n=1 Tax=Stentor coeruleus TaxID=5963 RepID=A0A1R2BZY7_9CILI|nr:hypothetical protein SteCoe_17029 [Stentor coeruleus]
MSAKHRRTPSAMPLIGYSPFDEEPAISFTSTLTFDPPSFHASDTRDKDNLKTNSKTTTNAGRLSGRKFFHNHSISSNNEYYSFLSSSTENLVKEMNKLHELSEEDEVSCDEGLENPKFDLNKAVNAIIKAREGFMNKLELKRKDIKCQLASIFSQTGQFVNANCISNQFKYCQNEVSDIDTERRVDSVRCSGDTVEGPGSAYHVDDLSLVKFDTSVENYEKKTKTVKFKGFN